MVPLGEGQELTAGGDHIDALTGQVSIVRLRPLFADLPEELHIGRPGRLGPLIALDFVGRRNEILREFQETGVGPDKLPVE
jgi:hypothetical protein